VLLLLAGCSQLFGLKHVDDPPADAVSADSSLMRCIDETFDGTSINTARFQVNQPPSGLVSQVGGDIQIDWTGPGPSGPDNYGGLELSDAIDLRGGQVSVDLVAFSGNGADGGLYAEIDAAHEYFVTVDSSTVEFDLYDGSSTSYTNLASMLYTQLPLTLSLSHDATSNMVTFSAKSPDGNAFTHSIPQAFTVQAVKLGFDAGAFSSGASAGTARYDNFIVDEPTCL
jgi:hypothetical protein